MSNFVGKGTTKFAHLQIFRLKVESRKRIFLVYGVECKVYGVECIVYSV